MAFAVDMTAAARRHLDAADLLSDGQRRDVAGYLYGIAAECAIKAMMLEAGMQPKTDRKAEDDAFFSHFPELRTMLRDALQRRRGTPLSRLVEDDRFLSNWSIRMRYSHGKDIQERWIAAWAAQARQAVGLIGT